MGNAPPVAALLGWYAQHRRRLPWRAEPGTPADPYRVWLSEIMLQQTTAASVTSYYDRFLSRFPSVAALAAAEVTEVMAEWAGLGYYARARNLHACAKIVAQESGFPTNGDALRTLPGIGAYTAAAIAAIAFGENVIPVDGNVERVAARLFAITTALPGARTAIRQAAALLATDPAARANPSDTAQALFDLGATVCTPLAPSCPRCPWHDCCAARLAGIAAELPRKAPKPVRPVRYGVHFWLTDRAGCVLLRRRPPSGLLGGMAELPGTPWQDKPWRDAEALALAPMPAAWRRAGAVRHGFTHFELRLEVFAARVPRIAAEGFLRPQAALAGEALPSLMRKCVRLAITGCRAAGEP